MWELGDFRTKPRVCPFPAVLKLYSAYPRKCLQISLSNISSVLCLDEVISAFRKEVRLGVHHHCGWMGVPGPEISRVPTLAACVGGEKLTSVDGLWGGWRSSSWEAESASLWAWDQWTLSQCSRVSLGGGCLLMTRKRETFPLKRFRSLWSLWQSLSYPFQQGTKIPSKQGPRSGLPWWLSGKESTHQCKRRGFNPCWGDPLEKEMATHSSVLAWRIPWTEEPGWLQSMGSQRVRHNLTTKQQCQGTGWETVPLKLVYSLTGLP